MTGLVDEAIRTLREEAPISLLRKVLRLVRTKKVRAIDDRYWDWQGGVQELTIGSASARFDAHSAAGGDAIRWLYLNEREMVRQLVTKLNPKDVFFDVGANVGFFSCFAANHVFDGQVIAFEPFPPNVEQLRRNLRRNAHENVDIKPVALSDSTGYTQFTAPDDGGVGGQTPSLVSGNGKFTVEQYTADDLIREGLPIPSVVKIDVEGAEPKVIRGMYEGLSHDRCRLLLCEIHLPQEGRPSIRDYGWNVDDVYEMIRELGFVVSNRYRRGNEVHLLAEK